MFGFQLPRFLGRQQPPVPYGGQPVVRGVNLGGWLVLEKWMTPDLFTEGAEDESSLCRQADWATLGRIREHRETFITREDFEWLAGQGISAVRLPIGYWVFGGAEPYRPTVRYVDRAFAWAQETGIQVLLCLHGAPGSQNGNDHSGQAGAVNWDKDEANVVRSLEVVMQLAKRYAGHPALLGFELLNEPSPKLDRRMLKRYYEAGYRIVRDACGNTPWVVFSDGLTPQRWRRILTGPAYTNVYIDTHQYQVFSEADKQLGPVGHIRKTVSEVARSLRKMGRYHQAIVGEWSVALDPASLQGFTPEQQELAYQTFGAVQLLVYGQARAWFYWSYKTAEGGAWSFRDCVARGWLPGFGKA